MQIGILVFEGADELDVVGPHRVFSGVNDVRKFVDAPIVDLHLVAENLGSVRLGGGLVIVPTDAFMTCPELDVLLVPGGSSDDPEEGRRRQQENATVLSFIKERAIEASVTASVCTGAFIVAAAGLLADKRVNTHWKYRDELRELMASRGEVIDVVAERVVWDGNLVTGGGVTSGIDVALSIVEKSCGTEVRAAVEAALELETPIG